LAYYAFGKKFYEMAVFLREIHNQSEPMHIKAGFADSPRGGLEAGDWRVKLRGKMGNKNILKALAYPRLPIKENTEMFLIGTYDGKCPFLRIFE